MKRKLVALGKNCLMAAIPKKWLDRQKLEKGDRIEFEELENYLLVSAKPRPKEKKISIRLKKQNRLGVHRMLQLLYDAGYKSVEIECPDKKILGSIAWSLEIMENWRIGETKGDKYLIKTVEDESESFDAAFRRIFLQGKELINLHSAHYTSNDKTLIEEIRQKHKLLLRSTMNMKRRINTSALPLEYKYYYFITTQIEEMADHYEYLLRDLETMNSIPKDMLALNKRLEKLFDKTYENFYKFDTQEFIDDREETRWKWFLEKKHPDLIYHLRFIAEKISNIAEYSVGIRMK